MPLSQRDSHLSQAQLHHQQVITAETPEDTDLCQGHLSQQQWITSDTPPEMKERCQAFTFHKSSGEG